MPYGDDITEGIPYVLSNPSGATTYSATGEAYDVAVAGLPFFLLNSDDAPRIALAPIRDLFLVPSRAIIASSIKR